MEAIKQVLSGNQYISKSVAELLKGKLASNDDLPVLTRREVEVLKLIADGLTNQEIADKLFTSKRTIETHRQNIIEKTQTKNTAALIRYAMSAGLIG